jgi:hypothetical protein
MKATGINEVEKKTVRNLAVGTKVVLHGNEKAIIVEKIVKKYNTKDIYGFVVILTIMGTEKTIPVSYVKEWEDNYNALDPYVVEYWKKAGRIIVDLADGKVGLVKKYLRDASISCVKPDLKATFNKDYKPPTSDGSGYEVKLMRQNAPIIVSIDQITDVEFFSHRPDRIRFPERVINFFKNLFKW